MWQIPPPKSSGIVYDHTMNTQTTFGRYILSSVTTFISSFLMVLGSEIAAGSITTWSWAVVFGLITVAVRAGIKAAVEGFAGNHADA